MKARKPEISHNPARTAPSNDGEHSLGGRGSSRAERLTEDRGQSDNRLHPGTACEVCGNEYDKPLEIVVNGISHYFDAFECAIQALAPRCAHCECRIIGHGLESGGQMFCCAHCASRKGVTTLKDRT